ncbi:hypothetical protein [Kutzneria kofuensis]|uniref:Uncharacterized protein n=1 Tax=Kutzneria kofuensis TaxID=103725 RepID=A0A7W9NI44_9PSEU|nr:hypothetical protein [Kutzneria kofuensis]MBB5893495.1 hypothetical protein [Kutzneria kofuensis]
MTRASRPVFVAVVVAVLVFAAAIGTTLVMRQLRAAKAASTSTQPAPTAPTDPVQLCGQAPCVKLTSVSMPQFKETVDLLADGKGHFARLRITSDRGAVLFSSQVPTVDAKSITCEEGRTSACLLQGKDGGDLIGEVYTDDGGTWRQTPIPFSSDGGYLALRDVNGDAVPDVVTTQSRCDDNAPASCTKVAVAVFQLTGEEIGCSVAYASPRQLPGWPDVTPNPAKLSECPS